MSWESNLYKKCHSQVVFWYKKPYQYEYFIIVLFFFTCTPEAAGYITKSRLSYSDRTQVYMHTNMQAHTHTYIHRHMHAYTCMCACTHARTRAHTFFRPKMLPKVRFPCVVLETWVILSWLFQAKSCFLLLLLALSATPLSLLVCGIDIGILYSNSLYCG